MRLFEEALVNCGGGGEHAGITNDFINAMANEDAEGLKNLFPESHRPLSDFSNFINYMKNKKFIRKGLKGWKNIKAKGYISTGDKIDIILTDEKGTYFIYHGLRIKKDGNNSTTKNINSTGHNTTNITLFSLQKTQKHQQHLKNNRQNRHQLLF